MKKHIKFIIRFIFVLWVVTFNQTILVNAKSAQPDVRQAFALAMENFGQFNQYEMIFKIENKDTNQTLLKGRLLHHVEEGNLLLDMSIYDYQSETENEDRQILQKVHPFRMLSYGNQKLVYLNQMEWLNSLGIFDLAPIRSSLQSEVSRYQRHWVAVNQFQPIEVSEWQQLFPLIENQTILEMKPDDVIYQNGAYHFNLERIDIPRNILNLWGNIQLNYMPKVTLDINQDKTGWLLNTEQDFSIDQHRSDIVINLGATFDAVDFFNPLTSSMNKSMLDEKITDLNREFTFSTGDVTQKMTEINYYLHPGNQHLSVEINGIAERIALNILGDQQNQLLSANYQLSVDIRPSNESIPPMTSISRLTSAEFNYLVNQALNP